MLSESVTYMIDCYLSCYVVRKRLKCWRETSRNSKTSNKRRFRYTLIIHHIHCCPPHTLLLPHCYYHTATTTLLLPTTNIIHHIHCYYHTATTNYQLSTTTLLLPTTNYQHTIDHNIENYTDPCLRTCTYVVAIRSFKRAWTPSSSASPSARRN